MNKKHKVLLIAEAANPDWVSVPLVGWSLAHALSKHAETHLVTQIRNKSSIENFGWQDGKEFTSIDSEALARPMYKIAEVLRMGQGKGWTMVQAFNALSYPYFEGLVWKKFGPAIKAGHYDLVHRITPLSPTISSSLARKCKKAGVPFVLGPLNGGVPWPKGFDSERRAEREWLSYLRTLYKILPGRTATLSNASCIITGSMHTKSEVPDRFQNKTVYIPENGIDPKKFPERKLKITKPVRACFIGRLVPYKGPDMLIKAALPLVKDGILELDIIGDGPMKAELNALVEKEDASAQIRLHGWVKHGDIANLTSSSQLLAFPSIREFGGGVVLEAMAGGLVPLIVDYAGPGELVNDTNGYKVPLGNRDEIIQSFNQKLLDICTNPDQLVAKSERARSDVQNLYTWDMKAQQVASIYRQIVSGEALNQKPLG